MQISRSARRVTVACFLVVALTPSPAPAATQQQVNDSVAAGATWLRTQQNVSTGQIPGFGGDYALSALSAAGIHPADVKGALSSVPSAQDYYATQFAGLSAPSSTAVLFGYAAGIDVQRLSESRNLVALLAGAYNGSGDLEGSFGNGSGNIVAFTALARWPGSAPRSRSSRASTPTSTASSTPTADGTSVAWQPTPSGRRPAAST